MTKLAPSTNADLTLSSRATDAARLFAAYRRRQHNAARNTFEWVFADIARYEALMRQWGAGELRGSRAFEVGYGGRPFRLAAMHSYGVDVSGVDAEVPVLDGSLRQYRDILSRNGPERLLKTAVRRALFDRREDAAFRAAVKGRDWSYRQPARSQFMVGDAAFCEPHGTFDLVYSHAVFEHVSREAMPRIVANIARWLKPTGIALITPDIFTGIHGGHSYEWRADTFDKQIERRSEPWEHLRKRRFTPNTFLNEMSRQEYRDVFSEHLEILDEINTPRTAAHKFLTPDVRAELAHYSDEDLLDPEPTFVLRRPS